MENLKQILVPLALFLLVFGVIYLFLTTRYRERMAMLDRGMDPRDPMDAVSLRQRSLRYGLLGIGVGLGLVAGDMVYTAQLMDNSISYPAGGLIGGGLGLLAYYLVSKPKEV